MLVLLAPQLFGSICNNIIALVYHDPIYTFSQIEIDFFFVFNGCFGESFLCLPRALFLEILIESVSCV